MTPREYLLRPAALRREISRRRERIGTLRHFAGSVSHRLKDVQVRVSPDPGRIQAFLDEAADEEAEVLRLEKEVGEAEAEAAMVLSRLPDRRLALLLEFRYLDGLDWPEVACRIHHSLSWTYKMHLQALSMLPDRSGPDPEQKDPGRQRHPGRAVRRPG